MEIGKLYTFTDSVALADEIKNCYWMAIDSTRFCVFHPENGLTRHPGTDSYVWLCDDINILKPYTENWVGDGLIEKSVNKFKFCDNK